MHTTTYAPVPADHIADLAALSVRLFPAIAPTLTRLGAGDPTAPSDALALAERYETMAAWLRKGAELATDRPMAPSSRRVRSVAMGQA